MGKNKIDDRFIYFWQIHMMDDMVLASRCNNPEDENAEEAARFILKGTKYGEKDVKLIYLVRVEKAFHTCMVLSVEEANPYEICEGCGNIGCTGEC